MGISRLLIESYEIACWSIIGHHFDDPHEPSIKKSSKETQNTSSVHVLNSCDGFTADKSRRSLSGWDFCFPSWW